MEIWNIILHAAITVLSLGMFLVSLMSYRRYKNLKLGFVSLAFLFFFIKGLFQSLGLFYDELTVMHTSIYLGVFDLIILIFLYIATVKR
jgi:hypothetical protein